MEVGKIKNQKVTVLSCKTQTPHVPVEELTEASGRWTGIAFANVPPQILVLLQRGEGFSLPRTSASWGTSSKIC